jgi:hypothetical protein
MIRYSDQLEVTRQVGLGCQNTLDPDLYAPLKKIYFKACQRRTGVRAMRVWFKEFSSPSPQLSLFPSESSEIKKTSQVIQALDRIRARHGETAIRYGIGA